jgi:hypothetical protein
MMMREKSLPAELMEEIRSAVAAQRAVLADINKNLDQLPKNVVIAESSLEDAKLVFNQLSKHAAKYLSIRLNLSLAGLYHGEVKELMDGVATEQARTMGRLMALPFHNTFAKWDATVTAKMAELKAKLAR